MIDWPEGMTADRRARFVLMRRFYWIRFDGNDEFLRGETKKKNEKGAGPASAANGIDGVATLLMKTSPARRAS